MSEPKQSIKFQFDDMDEFAGALQQFRSVIFWAADAAQRFWDSDMAPDEYSLFLTARAQLQASLNRLDNAMKRRDVAPCNGDVDVPVEYR